MEIASRALTRLETRGSRRGVAVDIDFELNKLAGDIFIIIKINELARDRGLYRHHKLEETLILRSASLEETIISRSASLQETAFLRSTSCMRQRFI